MAREHGEEKAELRKADYEQNEAIEVRAGLATAGADVKTTAGANSEHHGLARARSLGPLDLRCSAVFLSRLPKPLKSRAAAK